MLFTILYIMMSVNRFDTKLWLLLNNLLDYCVQLKEKKCANILICLKIFWLSCICKTVETNI